MKKTKLLGLAAASLLTANNASAAPADLRCESADDTDCFFGEVLVIDGADLLLTQERANPISVLDDNGNLKATVVRAYVDSTLVVEKVKSLVGDKLPGRSWDQLVFFNAGQLESEQDWVDIAKRGPMMFHRLKNGEKFITKANNIGFPGNEIVDQDGPFAGWIPGGP